MADEWGPERTRPPRAVDGPVFRKTPWPVLTERLEPADTGASCRDGPVGSTPGPPARERPGHPKHKMNMLHSGSKRCPRFPGDRPFHLINPFKVTFGSHQRDAQYGKPVTHATLSKTAVLGKEFMCTSPCGRFTRRHAESSRAGIAAPAQSARLKRQGPFSFLSGGA